MVAGCGSSPPPPPPIGAPAPAGPALDAAAPDATAVASPATGTGPGGCLTETELAAEQARIEAANEAAFQAGVAAAGLTAALLPIHVWRADESRPAPANPVVKRTIRGRDVTLVLLGTISGSCLGPTSAEFPFGRAGDTFHQLERRVTYRKVVVSACPRTTCPQPRVCGGAMRREGVGVELPPGATYAGTTVIPYEQQHVEVDFPHGLGIPCRPPDPPP
jgi:hypothetical protein